MPLSHKQDGQSKPLPHPHPLKSNSIRANPMRRPNIYLKRLRSNSVPNLAFADVSAAEASLIFSTGERAAARRRRPMSEYSPGPSTILNAEQDDPTPTKHTGGSTVPSGPAPSGGASTSPNLLASGRTSRHSTSSITSSDFDMDDTSSMGSIDEPISPLTAHSFPSESLQPQPTSPKRLVENQGLKAYADSLFILTQAQLNSSVPNLPIDLGLLVPHVKIDAAPPQPLDLVEGNSQQRPPLMSHFSDWSQTTFESDAEGAGPLTRWSSSVQTPDWGSQLHTPDETGLLSSESLLSEVTPKFAQLKRWTDTVSSSPTWISRASSPTRGSLRDVRSSSLIRSSPAPSEDQSYFANFDGHTAAAEVQLDLPFEISFADSVQRPSTRGSQLAKHNSIVAMQEVPSSSSDTTPLAKRNASPMGRQMVELSVRPPSWLVRAVC